ncbi:MAG: dihydroorotase [Ruminococcaceae bacterium]|nr:dihydroorotase [Oscillospiraceae bacterium]
MKILVKGGRVIDPANSFDKVSNVYINDGIIEKIGENLDVAGVDRVIDATGFIVAPGLIDMHVHLREPGFEYKEDIESGTSAAAMGGFTSVACMPNTNPTLDNAALIEFVRSRAKEVGKVNVFPIGCISKGQKGEELAPIGELKYAGAVAISDDGRPVENALLMKRALQYANTFDIPVISHCEDLNLVDDGSANEGFMATSLGLRPISPAAEEVMVARDVLLAENEGTKVHIAHISTKRSVEIIRSAKKRGVKVTCETGPHYFTLTDAAIDEFNTNAKMNPPLRSHEDVEAIIEGLRDGTIDAIATDHAPHHIDEKNCEFAMALNGIVGLETSLPLSITYLVKMGVLTMNELLEKMCVNPANILGLNKGTLEAGKGADIVIFDPDEKLVVDVESFKSKGKNSPYDGFELFGKVKYTIVGGNVVVDNGVLM